MRGLSTLRMNNARKSLLSTSHDDPTRRCVRAHDIEPAARPNASASSAAVSNNRLCSSGWAVRELDGGTSSAIICLLATSSFAVLHDASRGEACLSGLVLDA